MKIYGYVKENVKDNFGRIWGIKYINNKKWTVIHIDYIDLQVCVDTPDDSKGVYFNMQELQVINEKIKELNRK